MSKVVGPFGFKGTLGNISFFYRKGVPSARLKGNGLTKERILNDPKLKRVRENMSEFAGLALMANSLKLALGKILEIKDGTLRNRSLRIFADVKKFSGGVRGQRPFTLSQFRSLFRNFELNADALTSNVWLADSQEVASTPAATRNSSSVTISIDDVATAFVPPAEATHFHLMHALGIISDAAFNPETNKYALTAPDLNGVNRVTKSVKFPLGSTEPVSVTLETTLPVASVPENATVLEALGVEFFQEIDGALYRLETGRAMRIINVF